MSGRPRTISDSQKVDRSLAEFVEEDVPHGGRISILFSKHNNTVKSIKTTVVEPYSIEAVRRRVRAVRYGEIVITRLVDDGGEETLFLESTRVERFD